MVGFFISAGKCNEEQKNRLIKSCFRECLSVVRTNDGVRNN